MFKVKLTGVIVAWLAIVGVSVWLIGSCQEKESQPKSLSDAMTRVRAAGFIEAALQKSEVEDTENLGQSFTVSRTPMDNAVHTLTVNSSKEVWKGIAIIYPLTTLSEPPDHLKLVQWGAVWVLGDPKTVDEIVALKAK